MGYCGLCLPARARPRTSSPRSRTAAYAGLGGAGFPTGRKWSLVRAEKGPRLMAVNGDEGEPGTFKDRYHLERQPHKFLEGMLIAAWAVEAGEVFIYMRDEYPAVPEILPRRDRQARSRRASPSTPRCTSAAAPAPTSAAKRAP